MDKNDFNESLKDVLGLLSKEEIEAAITALDDCKQKVYEKSNQNKQELSSALQHAEINEAEVYIRGARNQFIAVPLKLFGASLLTFYDYWQNYYNEVCDAVCDSDKRWWLINDAGRAKCFVKEKLYKFSSQDITAYIRPIIVVGNAAETGLKTGDCFYINCERFKLLSDKIAIRTHCLDDMCTMKNDYEASMVKMCVDGWYAKLIKENKKTEVA